MRSLWRTQGTLEDDEAADKYCLMGRTSANLNDSGIQDEGDRVTMQRELRETQELTESDPNARSS